MAQINSVLDTMTYVLGDKGNYIKNLTTAGKGRAQDDKLFTELVLFDKKTFNQLILEIGNENTPMKCRMEIPKTQYSTDKDENVEVIDYVEFKNKCMIQAEKESTS